MGAKGVGIGRPYLWGLGAFGQPGVERALELLRLELLAAMQQVGAPSLKHLKPSMVVHGVIATVMAKYPPATGSNRRWPASPIRPARARAPASPSMPMRRARQPMPPTRGRRRGHPLGPLDGAIVSIKDLFDVAGEVTRAGSRVLADEAGRRQPMRRSCGGCARPAR